QSEEFSAEVVFETGPDDLLAVVEILGTDETDDRIDEQRFEFAGDGVCAGLEGLLVDGFAAGAEVCSGRQRRALAGFEVHDVVAGSSASERPARLVRLA